MAWSVIRKLYRLFKVSTKSKYSQQFYVLLKGEGIQDPQMNRKGRRTRKSRSEAKANKQRKRSTVADTEMKLSVRNLDKKQRTQIQEEEVSKIL